MKIESLSFCYTKSGWKITDVQLDNLTLLVGASGVGKTRILECVIHLRDTALDRIQDYERKSISWRLKFILNSQEHYEWVGERNKEDGFVTEEIFLNGVSIVSRKGGKVSLSEGTILKLNSDSSLLYLMGEDERIKPVINALELISYDSLNDRIVGYSGVFFKEENLEQKAYTTEEIRALKQSLLVKLYLAEKSELAVIKEIKQDFVEVFPFVEGVFIQKELYKTQGQNFNLINWFIKEVGVENPIPESELSSGMKRTFLQLCNLHLCPDGTIFLIDEFENSLGINCIDELTSILKSAAHRKLQFIITSHHPYIINQIHYKYWKLVTRHGGEVRVQNATDLIDFEKSRQQAFMQLTQLEEFTTGISE